MACRCAPALVALRREIDLVWPGRDRRSDGCCGDADHALRKSDHNPDASGYAHALDIDEDIAAGLGPAPLLFLKALLLRDPRTKYCIYERRIAYPDGTDKPYGGPNAHDKHLHVSAKPGATHDTRRWLPKQAPAEPQPTPPAVEDDMDRTAIPSWGRRTPTGRLPFYKLDVPEGSPPLVLAYNGAPLIPAGAIGVQGARAGSIFGVPYVTLPNLAAPPFGLEEGPGGEIVVLCVDGGTIDVARPPKVG